MLEIVSANMERRAGLDARHPRQLVCKAIIIIRAYNSSLDGIRPEGFMLAKTVR